jgi:5'-3' exonuclease
MGIQNFIRDLKRYFGYRPGNIRIENMRESKVAVDVSIWCFKAKYAMNEYNKEPIVRYFIEMILNFVSENIYPIFVFDGISPKLKELTAVKRNKESERKKVKIKKIEKEMNEITSGLQSYGIVMDTDAMIRYNILQKDHKRYTKELNLRPTSEELDQLRLVLNLIGIPHITMDHHDAENLCSYLQKIGYVKWVLSSDSDCLISGASNIIYDYSSKRRNYSIHYKSEIMKCLGFVNDAQLLHYSILLGTDYNDRIYGNGPKKCHSLVTYSTDFGVTEVNSLYEHYPKIFNEFNYDYIHGDPEFKDKYKFMGADNKKLFQFMNIYINNSLNNGSIEKSMTDIRSINNIKILKDTIANIIK